MGRIDPDMQGKFGPGRVDAARAGSVVAELAGSQHGVVARWQLLERGLGDAWIERALGRRHLHAVHHGVYAVGHPSLTKPGRLMAAVLAGGAGALLSHASAGALWGLVEGTPGVVEITVRRVGRGGRRGIRMHRPRRFPLTERRVTDGIPLTSPARTLLDLAAVLGESSLRDAVRAADRRNLLDVDRVAALASGPGRRGTGTLRGLLAAYRPVPQTRSWLEDRFIDLVDDAGLPRPAVDVVVEGLEVDCLWPAEAVIVELDSWGFHGDPAAFEADRRRDARLQLAGYVVLRFTRERIRHDSAGAVAELAAMLARRATRRG